MPSSRRIYAGVASRSRWGPGSLDAEQALAERAKHFDEGSGGGLAVLHHVVDGVFSVIEMEFSKRDVKLHYPKSLTFAFG